jgi:hypothetical protein
MARARTGKEPGWSSDPNEVDTATKNTSAMHETKHQKESDTEKRMKKDMELIVNVIVPS